MVLVRRPTNVYAKRWTPSLSPMVKINSDVAFNQASRKRLSRIICRDKRGTVIGATSPCLYASSPIAKALSLHEAMSFGRNLQLQYVIFEFDSQILIAACRGQKVTREIKGIIDDIKWLKLSFMNCTFTWVSREGNIVVHMNASLASSESLVGNWALSLMSLLRRAIIVDCRG